MRILSEPYRGTITETAKTLERHDLLPKTPKELVGKTLAQMLEDGSVKAAVDEKYPQAVGISQIIRRTALLGNFKWEILVNEHEDSPFFTSDFPVAIEKTPVPQTLCKVVPLSPYLALRIFPDIELDKDKADLDFANFGYRVSKLSRSQVGEVNKLIVRSAESLVFFPVLYDWIPKFVNRNSPYRIEPVTSALPTPSGSMMIFSQRIARIDSDKNGT